MATGELICAIILLGVFAECLVPLRLLWDYLT